MTSDVSPRFSPEEIAQCQSWLLPDVSSEKILPSAEKEALDKESESSIEEHVTMIDDTSTAAGEDIDLTEESFAPFTAEQLQAITDEAEKEGYEAGYQKGLEQGEKAGYEEALTSTKQKIEQSCEQLEHVIEALLIPLKSEQQQLESMILDMVCRLTRAIVQREMQIDSSQITELIQQALLLLPTGTEKYTLFLNSQDADQVKSHLSQSDKECLFQIDDALIPGGCRLEAQVTRVDQSVEQRMETLLTAFLEKHLPQAEEKTELLDRQSDDRDTEDKRIKSSD